MKFFDWLAGSLTSSFSAAASTPENTLARAQDKFFDAIEKEDSPTIERIAHRYPDFLSWRDGDDRSGLRVAQDSNSLQSFIALIGVGANRHEDYGNGLTPLLLALRKNDPFFTDFLMEGTPAELSVLAKAGDYSYTALHLAVLNRDHDRALKLIELGADQNIRATPNKKSGEVTPAELATQLNMPKLAEMLTLADEIREVKAKERAELEAIARKNAYIPKGNDPAPAGAFR